jgi:predicted Zn-ribbon and HTH transcriptional regulator
MDQHQVIRFMKRFPDKIYDSNSVEPWVSNKWRCDMCGKMFNSLTPIPIPALCNECKGIYFTKLK